MIWFDLDNTPHVPLFRPILRRLEQRGVPYVVTARPFAQTTELLDLWRIPHLSVGSHAGKNKAMKVLNLFVRALQLRQQIARYPVTLAVSHGSRTQLVASALKRCPSLVMMDYEYTETRLFSRLATRLLVPVYIPDQRLAAVGIDLRKVHRYHGFKEELYLADFAPDADFRQQLGVGQDQVLVVLRPPSMVGNYHDARSEQLFLAGIRHFASHPAAVCLIVNRTRQERQLVLSNFRINDRVRFLEHPVDGLQLLYAADIAISGGGTMNREAALLGTAAFSVFTGRRPYLDEYLGQQGRLRFIERPDDYRAISIERVPKKPMRRGDDALVDEITNIIIQTTGGSQ